jgi:hypothetical protein
MKKTSFLIIVTLLITFISCSNPVADDSSAGGGVTPLSLVNLISNLPISEAKIPGSLDPLSDTRTISRGINDYDNTGESGVMTHDMKMFLDDYIINFNKIDANESRVWGRVFVMLLKEASSTLTLAYNTDITLGTLNFPTGTKGPTPATETSMDFGTIRIENTSSTVKEIYWTPAAITDYGQFYIKLIVTDLLDTAGNIKIETYMILEPEGAEGTYINYIYESINEANGEVFLYNSDGDAHQWFMQYTDNEGRICSAYQRKEDAGDASNYAYMIGNDQFAAIAGIGDDGNGNGDSVVSVYNADGHLLRFKNNTADNQIASAASFYYTYPLYTLTKSGFTLKNNDATGVYWYDNDTSGDPTAIDGDDISLGTYVTLDSNNGGDNFYTFDGTVFTLDSTVDYYNSETDIIGIFDNTNAISDIEDIIIPRIEDDRNVLGVDRGPTLGFPTDMTLFP